MIMQALNTFPGEMSLAQLSCIIVNSIAMTSGDMYESIKTRELVTAFKTVSFGWLAYLMLCTERRWRTGNFLCCRHFYCEMLQSVSKIGNKKPEEKAVRDECQKTVEALGSSEYQI